MLGVPETGIKLKGRRSTPGRYFQVAEPGTSWGGTNIDNHQIAAHHPICTVVATARTPEAVLAGLEARADAVRAELLEPARG